MCLETPVSRENVGAWWQGGKSNISEWSEKGKEERKTDLDTRRQGREADKSEARQPEDMTGMKNTWGGSNTWAWPTMEMPHIYFAFIGYQNKFTVIIAQWI